MRTAAFFLLVALFVAGCAPKSELDATRAKLEEAQRQVQALERDRVPRIQYDRAHASLKIADDRIATLEYELKLARAEAADLLEKAKSNGTAFDSPEGTAIPTAMSLTRGNFSEANETRVFSDDAQLEFGPHLKVTSPTGLLVADPEMKVVGGDLAIKARNVTIESSGDGLLLSNADGTVKFIGNTLTMKFDEKKATPTTAEPEKVNTAKEAQPVASPQAAPQP
ncbi:MAG: hypothetical protein QM790_07910 [Nibricoccus sp.]